mmetsp:Transcript_17794/g.35672  ORF Transcript_17794/g.35672 Transcript_17794/m.35672 type:complete len:574 (+) Transcript_17794:223-1944(+)
MAGFPAAFPLAPLDPTWGLSFHGPNPFDTQPLLQFNNSLKDGDGGGGVDDTTIDDTIDVDGLHDAANFLLGNTLHYTPHNFHQPIVIPYPTTIGGCCYDNDTTHTNNNNNKRNNNNVISLPVCAKCKRHYKTRENCRVKYMHTDVPWTNSFICITIDESCIGTDGTYIVRNDQKLHAVVLPSPPPLQSADNNEKQRRMTKYVVNSCLDGSAPVCLACKQSNRTKAYCRKKFRHRELPWNTLFVLLKLQQQQHTASDDAGGDGGGGSITFQSSIASTERDGGDGAIAEFLDTFREGGDVGGDGNNNNKMPPLPTDAHLSATDAVAAKDAEKQQQQQQTQEQTEPNKLEAEFDINCIAPSRTFLSIISSTENSIRWLTQVATEDDDHTDETSKKSSSPQQQQYYPQLNNGGRDSSQSILNESVTTKKKTKRKKKGKKVEASTTSSLSKNNSKKSKSKVYKLDNAKLALEAIEYAKAQAKKEQEAALLMTQRFARFTQQPQLIQQQQQHQQQQQLLLLQQPQQAIYQLQDTTEKQSKSDCDNDQSYGEEEMPVANNLEEINEQDILDEAAKLAEWL